MAHKNKPQKSGDLARTERKQQQQQKKIAEYEKREKWMRWGAIGVLALILLLFLMAGYATDWLRGLKKDEASKTTPIASQLDSANAGEGGANTNQQGTSTTRTNTQNNTGTNNRESSSSTTIRETTNNNNTVTPAPPSTPTNPLLDLYLDANVGDTLDDVLNLGESLGVEAQCDIELLIKVCDFEVDGSTVTVRSLLGTGIVTSVTKNF